MLRSEDLRATGQVLAIAGLRWNLRAAGPMLSCRALGLLALSAVREGLSEEELAMFDILTQPEPKLGPEDEDLVKRVAKSLLDKLKAEKLVLDWRLKERAKAGVKATIAALYDATMNNCPPPTIKASSTKRSSGPINGYLDIRKYPGGQENGAMIEPKG